MKTILSSIILALLINNVFSQCIPVDSLYLGQTPPGDSAIVFASGLISLPGRNEPCITFSPDGKSAFFYIEFWPSPKEPFVMFTEYKNGKWTTPDTANFAKNRKTGEPIFAFSGSRIYLTAKKALNQVGALDLCYVEKVGESWSNPKSLGNPPNQSMAQFHPCIVADSSIYFADSKGDICRCQYKNGRYLEFVTLPYPINYANTSETWGDPYVAPDESYLIFKSTRIGGYGQNDIYISYKKTDGTWTNPKNLGRKINTSNDETSGDVTPDGKYMTFGSNQDLYWVSTSFIDSLKHTNFTPYLKTKIKDQTVSVGHSFSFSIPDSTFIDDDGNNTLTYKASLDDGFSLPSWLSFNSETATFSGVPASTGVLTIKVTATDAAKAFVYSKFEIQVVK